MVRGLNEVNGHLSATENMASKFGKTLAGLGVGLAVGAVLRDIFTEGVQEAKDGALITAQFAAGIKSTGNAANVTVGNLWDLAGSISAYSGQTKDSVAESEKLLLTFTNIKNVGPNKIFDQATRSTADMATVFGGTASDNAIKLGKALNDPIAGMMALGKMGITFSDDQKKLIRKYQESGQLIKAQQVILDEVYRETGGAAEAAGGTWVGALNKAQNAFAEMSGVVVETFLPAVLPAITWVSKALKDAEPGIAAFTDGLGKNIQTAITVSKPLMDGIAMAAQNIGTWITTSAVPAFQGLVAGWQEGTGPGGAIRDIVGGIWSVIKLLGDALGSLDLPGKFRLLTFEWQLGTGTGGQLKDAANTLVTAFSILGTYVSGTLVPAIKDASTWIIAHKDDLLAAAIAINIILLPAYITAGVAAVASGITQVGAWVSTKIAAATSAAEQLIASYSVIAGWVSTAGAAIASGATSTAIWLLYAQDAVVGAAKVVGSHLVVVGGWVSTGVAAVAAGLAQVGVWAEQGLQAVIGAAKVVGAHALVVAGWIADAATATASGIAMAAAWVVGLGPIAWIIAGVALLVGAFVWAYNNIGWFRDGVNVVWHAVTVGFSAMVNWIVDAWNNTINFITTAPGKMLDGLNGMINDAKRIAGNIIDGIVNGIRDGLGNIGRAAVEMATRLWNDFKRTLGIGSPSRVFADLAGYAVDGAVLGITRNLDALGAAGSLMGDVLSASFTPNLTVPKLTRYGSSSSYGASGPTQITINVSVPATANQVEIGREIYNAMNAYDLASGR